MNVESFLEKNKSKIGSILPEKFRNAKFTLLNLSKTNNDISKIDFSKVKEFNDYVTKTVSNNNALFAVGKYNEDRVIYNSFKLFSGAERRTIHLGIDLFMPPNTDIYAPLDAEVHSFKDNNNPGDYGPTIILTHKINNVIFYTLYGHLSRESLNGLFKGKKIKKGDLLCRIGTFPINGNWPPHLHFQIITDMKGLEGDYFGAASHSTREEYLKLCPNPNLILNLKL
ncbi:Peptidase family M23 [Candidatus Tiddalikarchaeum anstoanum]|nr:Peptidase family M23 [Candidatus Tiddalikarchaeum anstoanum]